MPTHLHYAQPIALLPGTLGALGYSRDSISQLGDADLFPALYSDGLAHLRAGFMPPKHVSQWLRGLQDLAPGAGMKVSQLQPVLSALVTSLRDDATRHNTTELQPRQQHHQQQQLQQRAATRSGGSSQGNSGDETSRGSSGHACSGVADSEGRKGVYASRSYMPPPGEAQWTAPVVADLLAAITELPVDISGNKPEGWCEAPRITTRYPLNAGPAVRSLTSPCATACNCNVVA